MWDVELPVLGALTPSEQLWVIAQALVENGGPPSYALALRRLAERLEELGWWLGETKGLSESLTPGACTRGPTGKLRS
jgi:hypothetical protein